MITSREHSVVKRLIRLQKSSHYRRKTGTTLLDGIHLIQSYLSTSGVPLRLIVNQAAQKNREVETILNHCQQRAQIPILLVTNNVFEKISPVQTPTGILAHISIPQAENDNLSSSPPYSSSFCILLESIQDPGNLGTILRTAAAADFTDCFLSPDCTDAWSPKTLRAAMGAHFFLAIHSDRNLVKIADNFPGQVLATSPSATKNLFEFNLVKPTAFIFGNEGRGLTDTILRAADETVSIPMPGKTESINAAAAATICMFEKVRQHLQKAKPEPRLKI